MYGCPSLVFVGCIQADCALPLPVCFYIFDKDKNGYIEEDELHALVQMLHHNAMNSNLKMSLEKLDNNKDGRIDFSTPSLPVALATATADIARCRGVPGYERDVPTGDFPGVPDAVKHDDVHPGNQLLAWKT